MEYHSALLMLLIICKISDAAICDENGKEVCCSGYMLDENEQCVKCLPGHTGPDCVYTCVYPYYGEDCFMKCDCSAEMCDFVSGCKYVSTTAIRSTSYNTTRMDKPLTPTTDAVTQDQSLKESTESYPASPIGLFSIPTVVNITIVLISVFVISFLIYGLSYLRKVFTSRQNNKLNLQYSANNNAVYECVEFPRHM